MSKIKLSKVNITYKETNDDLEYDVPLFIQFNNENSLYMLVKEVDDSYKLLCINNGHIQMTEEYKMMKDFFRLEVNARVVDVNIEVFR